MFSLVLRPVQAVLTLAALRAPALDSVAQSRPDPWRPRTLPLFAVSYSPGIGLLVGAGVTHTRCGFRALPPSTRLVAQAEYGTGARTYRATLAIAVAHSPEHTAIYLRAGVMF